LGNEATFQSANPKSFMGGIKFPKGNLNEGSMLSMVHPQLPLFASGIAGRVLHSPYLKVPAIGKEVGMETTVKGQDWFIEMSNLMFTQPVVNPKFVGRSDKMAVVARHPLTPVPTIQAQGNPILSAKSLDDPLADSVDIGNRGKAESRSVLAFQRSAIRQDDPFAARFCTCECRDAMLLHPMRDGGKVNTVEGGNLSVWSVFDVNHSVQLIFGRRNHAPVGQPTASWPCRDTITDEPSPYTDMFHRVQCCDGAGSEALSDVQIL